jgi:tetratricopeptide (TPR) repeat protein
MDRIAASPESAGAQAVDDVVQVFLSYRRHDGTRIADFVSRLIDGYVLSEQGRSRTIRCYYDLTEPTRETWQDVHFKTLKVARAIIFLATPGCAKDLSTSTHPDWLYEELRWWMKHRSQPPIVVDASADERFLPDPIKCRWPHLNRIVVKPSDVETDSPDVANRLQARLAASIRTSEHSVLFEDLSRFRRLNARLRLLLSLAAILVVLVVVLALFSLHSASASQTAKRLSSATLALAESAVDDLVSTAMLPDVNADGRRALLISAVLSLNALQRAPTANDTALIIERGWTLLHLARALGLMHAEKWTPQHAKSADLIDDALEAARHATNCFHLAASQGSLDPRCHSGLAYSFYYAAHALHPVRADEALVAGEQAVATAEACVARFGKHSLFYGMLAGCQSLQAHLHRHFPGPQHRSSESRLLREAVTNYFSAVALSSEENAAGYGTSRDYVDEAVDAILELADLLFENEQDSTGLEQLEVARQLLSAKASRLQDGGERSAALVSYQQLAVLCLRLVNRSPTVVAFFRHVNALNAVGDLQAMLDRPEAEATFREAVGICEQGLQSSLFVNGSAADRHQLEHLLSGSLNNVASALLGKADGRDAYEAYTFVDRALTMSKALVASNPDHKEFREWLCRQLLMRVMILERSNDVEEKRSTLEDLAEQLRIASTTIQGAKSADVDEIRGLASVMSSAAVCMARHRVPEHGLFEDAVRLWEDVVAREQHDDDRRQLGNLLCQQASALAEDKPVEAMRFVARAIAVQEAVLQNQRRESDVRLELSRSLETNVSVLLHQGRLDDAVHVGDRLLKLWPRHWSSHMSLAHLFAEALAYVTADQRARCTNLSFAHLGLAANLGFSDVAVLSGDVFSLVAQDPRYLDVARSVRANAADVDKKCAAMRVR